jgi:16S rRNA (cytosine967-C5)-methyltransferase
LLKDAWALAIETLSQIELKRLSERLALSRTSKQLRITNADAIRYAYGLVAETVRRKNLIDKFIHDAIKPKTLEDLSLNVSAFLQLYVYQTRAAKNWAKTDLKEAENIARLGRAILGWKTLRPAEPFLGFLLTRQAEPVLKAANDEERIALSTFHPDWFVRYCFRLFGRSEAIAFLEGSVYPPPLFIRLNTLKNSEEEILKRLESAEVKLEKIEPLRHAYKVTHTKRPLTALLAFQEGLFYVQDKASCFAAEVADPKPGMTVLDVCAAPGAKTTYLAQLMQNLGVIFSIDYSKRRMKTWMQEITRTGTGIAESTIADARTDLPFTGEADLAVLDPPCTSTGVFGRQPSAKWRLTPASIEKMAEIQWQMINKTAVKVGSGGTLAYSTCSVTVEENEMIIERFLKWHSEFQLGEITPKLGSPGLRGLDKCRRLYPHRDESNGFFIAKLAKL